MNENKKIIINASVKDKIDWVLHFSDNKIPEHMLTKDIYLDSDSTKEDIIEVLKNAKDFYIEDGTMVCTIDTPQQELDEWNEDRVKNLDKWIKILKKSYENEKYKEQIDDYLEKYEINWLMEELGSDRIALKNDLSEMEI